MMLPTNTGTRSLALLAGIIGVFFTSVTSAQDCDPSSFSSMDENSVAVCEMLYRKFEAALLVPLNLYKLRHVMFPNERAQPLVVKIACSITFKNLSQDLPCAGANNNSLLTLNEYHTNITWTDSVTLSIIDPDDFDFLQPAVLTLTSPIVRPYYSMENPNFVAISLSNDTMHCTPSEIQVKDVLEDLTTKVSNTKHE